MSPEMRRITDDYLARLRRCLRGVAPDVLDEVQREIHAHIDDALAARDAHTVSDLLDVLDRLGPPEDYARDLGLYMMVDRGYRDWSVPHMVRSTAFWALSTVAGALVVGLFGVLYALAAGLILVGLQRLSEPYVGLPLPRILPGAPPALLIPGGIVALAGLTVVVRWFIGQYVVSARPHTLGGAEADSGWVRRTSRRIVTVAAVAGAVTLVAGLGAGAYAYDVAGSGTPFSDVAPPVMAVAVIGLTVLLLSPVLGLVWTVIVEHGDDPAGRP